MLIALATVLTGAIMAVNSNTKRTETKYLQQVKVLEARTRAEQTKQVDDFKKQLEDKDRKYEELKQSKAAEKARLAAVEAAKTPVVSKVVQSIVPTAQAATGSHTELMAAAGISPSDYQYVEAIVTRESGWRHWIVNSIGATGLCQSLPGSKMASAGADYLTNPVTQLRWCSSYAQSRYGGWANAWSAWQSKHWW